MGLPVACVPWPKLETGSHTSVVSVKGRTLVERWEGALAVVGIGTGFPILVVGGELGCGVLRGGSHLRQSLFLPRGVGDREADECRLDHRVRKRSLGVVEALGGSLWVAFKA